MGGTFDPIHHGHLVAASEVADLFELDDLAQAHIAHHGADEAGGLVLDLARPTQLGRDIDAQDLGRGRARRDLHLDEPLDGPQERALLLIEAGERGGVDVLGKDGELARLEGRVDHKADER